MATRMGQLMQLYGDEAERAYMQLILGSWGMMGGMMGGGMMPGMGMMMPGMMGGYPGAVNRYRCLRDSNVQERMKRAELVGDIDELTGKKEELGLRQQDFAQNPTDVYAVLWSAAGGFGDPLERDPARVEADVENGDVTAEAAKAIYGVVVGDASATALERDRQRFKRVGKRSGKKLDGEPDWRNAALASVIRSRSTPFSARASISRTPCLSTRCRVASGTRLPLAPDDPSRLRENRAPSSSAKSTTARVTGRGRSR